MGKNIVFCADGTWNGPGQPDADNVTDPPTNVFKLFLNLAGEDHQGTIMLAKEQERILKDADGTTVLQWAKYLHGVGDSQNQLVQWLGGSVGAGLIERIVRGYTFISRNFEPGDRIYIVGFSRGAYTARALAGMIAKKGLLNAQRLNLDDRDNAYRLGSAVWYSYRNSAGQTGGWLQKLEALVDLLPGFIRSVTVTDDMLIGATIEVVAVWDTVGSYGIPIYTPHDATIDVFQFADTVLSDKVLHGIHAVAVDERRANFTPTFWTPAPRIQQVLFPGAHADVGGGYAIANGESGLSDCTLAWMSDALKDRGVAFLDKPACSPRADATATAHAPWLSGIWSALPKAPRTVPPGMVLSEEIIERLQAPGVTAFPTATAAHYEPCNLAAYLQDGGPANGVTVV